MFGLMKRAERLSYCGSCKTIGAIYGQRARLLLNHDMVFLAELRMGEPEWTPAHKSFNCMAMPKEHPEALKYAAAATMVLSHFQISDHVADSGKRRWRAAQRFFSASYRKAAADLRASGFPLDELTQVLGTQREREASAESLHHVAEPTARASELVFGHGAPQFASIGRRFGYLIYVLDAWEDRARDAKSGEFNALLAFPEVDGRSEILATMQSLQQDLPAKLADRLRANVEERLGMRPRVLHGACQKSAADRWKSAVAFARSMKAKERAGILKGAAVLATVSVLAFFAPHQIRSAESWKQCFGVGLNLMAFGGLFATVPVPEAPAPGDAGPAKGGKSSSGGTSWCSACGDCCNCCECCECAECCSCCDC